MVHETLYTCYDLYEQGTGAKWENLVYARTGEGFGAYVHPQGSKSKTEYKAKDLCYIYKYDKIDPTKYKVGNIYWTVVFRKYNLKKNDFPKIRIYSGKKGNNTFIREITAFTKLENLLEYDNHTLQFNLGALTIDQLKSLIVKVVWDKTKSTEKSEISINRARLSINYLPLQPKFSLYASPSLSTITNNDTFTWTLTAKNTGDCGTGTATVKLPNGVTVVSANSSKYNNTTKKWTFTLCKDKSETLQLRLRFPYVGRYNINATNDSEYRVNSSVSSTVNVEQYYPSPNSERIIYTFYPSFAWEDGYFDVGIYGVYNGEELHCYDIDIPNGITVGTPLRDVMIDLQQNTNVEKFIRTDDADYTITSDNRICLKVNDVMTNFEAHIRIPFHSQGENALDITTHSNDSNVDYLGTLHILEPRGLKLIASPVIGKDTKYVYNSMNIGSPNVWTIRAKASRKNFFEEKEDTLAIDLEQMIAYIGVIPLSRCHKADVTANSKNSLIENRYLNRAYYGKKGDYSEDIKMTLRMKWQDVATLQGLCEMDKPIPIDTIPYYADGDPLNHRGWAEISGVTNIKKINDLYYECDVEVKYLTHKIITKFGITEKGKITATAIKYYLSLVHDFTDDITELFRPNYYQNFTTVEDMVGNSKGVWELDAPSSLTLVNKPHINKYSTYDFIFRNHLPVLMSEDFDGNWEMALRLKSHTTGKTVFEHIYNNFKHYDFENNIAVNSADVTTNYLNGTQVENLNFDKVGLGYDSQAQLVEDRKKPTHINSMETPSMTTLDFLYEAFLLDSDNKGIPSKVVHINIESDDGYKNKFDVVTDIFGRFFFNPRWGNGTYNITIRFDEDEDYRSATYSTSINVELDEVRYHFEYPRNYIALANNSNYVFTLLDEDDEPVADQMVHYSFKRVNGSYGYERTVITDENGQGSIPIDCLNGTNVLKVNFKGYSWNGTTYEPVMFEEEVNVNIVGDELTIEADDVEIVMGDISREYNVLVKNSDGVALENIPLNIAIYNDNDTFLHSVVTNEYGVATVPLLINKGAYGLDVHFLGDNTYKPQLVSRGIVARDFERLETHMVSNKTKFNEEDKENRYYVTLLDSNNTPLSSEPVHFEVFDSLGETRVDVTVITYPNGRAYLPFVSHGESVYVQAEYDGGVKYDSSELLELIEFEETFDKELSTIWFDSTTNEFKLTRNSVDYVVGKGQNYAIKYCITYVEDINDGRKQISGEDVFNHLEDGTYKVTIDYHPTHYFPYHSIAKTFLYTHTTDTRTDVSHNHTLTKLDSVIDGVNTYHIDFGNNFVSRVLHIGHSSLQNPSVSDLEDVQTIVFKQNEDFQRYATFSFINEKQVWGYFEDSIGGLGGELFAINTDPVTPVTRSNSTLYVNGFGVNGKSYNNIDIRVNATGVAMNTRVNDKYLLRLIDMETFEELQFSSYLSDSITPVTISTLLKGDSTNPQTWRMNLITTPTDDYKGHFYTDDKTIYDDFNYPVTNSVIFDPETFIDGSQLTFTDDGFGFDIAPHTND